MPVSRGSTRCRANGAPPANFAEWIDRSFGAGIAAIFLRPYNHKVWGCRDWKYGVAR